MEKFCDVTLVTSFDWRNGDDVTKWRHDCFFDVQFCHNQLEKPQFNQIT